MTVVLAILSLIASLGIVAPAPLYSLLPLSVAAPELAPWLIAFNLACCGFALFKRRRRTAAIFIAGLIVAAWPVYQANKLGGVDWAACFRGMAVPNSEAEVLPLNIHYYAPTGPGPHPAIITIYGGGWSTGTPANDTKFNLYWASKGYSVFAIDYRHAPAAQYPAQIEDVRSATRWIQTNAAKFQTDPARLLLCGRSSGGQLALQAAYEPGAVPVKGVIAFYPPTDLVRGYTEQPVPDPIHVRRVLENYLGGSPSTQTARYREASPLTYATRSLPPTLLIQGQRDHIVKPELTRAMFRALRANGNPAVLLELPWSDHAFDEVFSGLGSQIALRAIQHFLNSIT